MKDFGSISFKIVVENEIKTEYVSGVGALPSAIKCAPPCADSLNYSTNILLNNYCHKSATMLSHPSSTVLTAVPAVGSVGVDASISGATHVITQHGTQGSTVLATPTAHHTQQSANVAMSQLGTVYATKRRRRNGKRLD